MGCFFCQTDGKDIVAEANDIGELEGYVGLVWDPQVIYKRLWKIEREKKRKIYEVQWPV